jgi:hypothetical protein
MEALLIAILAFFAVGSTAFWVLMAVIGCFIAGLVEAENGFWATIVAILTICGINWGLKYPVFKTIQMHPWRVLGLIGIYLAAGALWSIAKWFFFVHKKRMAYEEFKAKFLRDQSATELTPKLAAELADAITDHYDSRGLNQVPNFREHYDSLTRWATYWPFSMIGTIFSDFVRKVWRYIVEFLGTTYERIATHSFRNITADQDLAAEYRKQAEETKYRGR